MSIDKQVLAAFYNIISDSKQMLFDDIASNRTRYITVAMEHIQKNHNASAVLRTCDCFGIQDLHTIEKNQEYTIHKDIARGAENWVDIFSHTTGENPSIECIDKLKKKGYKIVATSPHADQDVHQLNLNEPIALFFGTERDGISPEVQEKCDEIIKIPMFGFTESFNISVSAAVILSIIRHRLSESQIDWKLSEEDQVKLKILWSTKIIKEGEDVEKEIRHRILEKE